MRLTAILFTFFLYSFPFFVFWSVFSSCSWSSGAYSSFWSSESCGFFLVFLLFVLRFLDLLLFGGIVSSLFFFAFFFIFLFFFLVSLVLLYLIFIVFLVFLVVFLYRKLPSSSLLHLASLFGLSPWIPSSCPPRPHPVTISPLPAVMPQSPRERRHTRRS